MIPSVASELHKLHELHGKQERAFGKPRRVAVSPSITYRVLKDAGLLQPWNAKPTKKGTGLVQPIEPLAHWQVDFSYLNVAGTFYYLCSALDGCSCAILSSDFGPAMKEADAVIVLQRAHEAHPGFRPRVITNNSTQFVNSYPTLIATAQGRVPRGMGQRR